MIIFYYLCTTFQNASDMKQMRLAIGVVLAMLIIAAFLIPTNCHHSDRQAVEISDSLVQAMAGKASATARMFLVEDLSYLPVHAVDPVDDEEDKSQPKVPPCVLAVYDQSVWDCDTICTVDGTTYFIGYTDNTLHHAIFTDNDVLLFAPVFNVIPTDKPNTFTIRSFDQTITVDFSKASDLQRLSAMSRQLPSFKRFFKEIQEDNYAHASTSYSVTVDYPSPSVNHSEGIRRWLVNDIISSAREPFTDTDDDKASKKMPAYKGNINNTNQIFKHTSNLFLKGVHQAFDPERDDYCIIIFGIDLQARCLTDKYVTYQKYCHDYEGGLHGDITERLISYDYVHQQPIDFDYLFRPNTSADVLYQLMQVAQKDRDYREWNASITDYAFVTDDDGKRTGEIQLPTPGLTEKGFVFSFQPYDICCFAAGAFHFTVPYKLLRPYLTDRAKWCLGL